MLKGQIILGAFFIGPRSFYRALKEMSEEERQQFGMSGVNKVNQLYGGEAVSYTHLDVYKRQRYGKLIAACGGSDPLKQGLYGSSEMFVDPFIPLYRNGILKRKVFESIPLMKLVNENKLSADSIPEDIDVYKRQLRIQP